MVTLVQDPFVKPKTGCGEGCGCASEGAQNSPQEAQRGYDGYVEPDTKIPPKAKAIVSEVSVNGKPIAEGDILVEAQQHPAENPGEALKSAARALVVRELLLLEAHKLELKPDPQNDETGRAETDEDALIRQLMEHEIDTPVTTEIERRRYYDAHSKAFHSEAIYEARHILIAHADKDAASSASDLATGLIADLQKRPHRFAAAAREFSACSSKDQEGNLGQLTKGSTVPEFEAVLEKMEAGQIWPEPVKSRFGFHIIYLVNKIPGALLPFEYVEERIGAWLEASSWSKAVSQYITILAGRADIKGIDLNGVSSPLVQ